MFQGDKGRGYIFRWKEVCRHHIEFVRRWCVSRVGFSNANVKGHRRGYASGRFGSAPSIM